MIHFELTYIPHVLIFPRQFIKRFHKHYSCRIGQGRSVRHAVEFSPVSLLRVRRPSYWKRYLTRSGNQSEHGQTINLPSTYIDALMSNTKRIRLGLTYNCELSTHLQVGTTYLIWGRPISGLAIPRRL